MKNIVYIHGAGQTRHSFEFIKKNLPEHVAYIPEYTMDYSVKEIINMIYNRCIGKFDKEPINIIGHSLGGIIALHLKNTDLNIEKIISISAPFAGIEGGEFLRLKFPEHKLYNDMRGENVLMSLTGLLFPLHKFFNDIIGPSPIIEDLKKINKDNVLGIITTAGGIPLLGKPNDGAVTIESQKALDIEMIEYNLNHFEVMLSDEVCKKIIEYLI